MSMKKLITPAVLTAIGFAAFNEHVREAFMTQPNWLMIVEASVAYMIIGFLNGVDVAAKVAMHCGRSYFKDPDGIAGVFSGLLWPIDWVVVRPAIKFSNLAQSVAASRLESLRNKRDAVS